MIEVKRPGDADYTSQRQSLEQSWQEIRQAHSEANFLQSPSWGVMNRLIGHKVIIESNVDAQKSPDNQSSAKTAPKPHDSQDDYHGDRSLSWCLMIVKNAKRGRYLEIPGGPLIDWQDSAAVDQVFARLRAVAKQEHCVFIRLRPQLRRAAGQDQILATLGASPAPMHLHAEHTVILDLTKSTDELLAAMRRQTRYEVRRAAKLGITVEWAHSEEIFREFHQVQVATAARQHFVPPDLETLLAEREAFGDNARIYIARSAEGEPISYGLILIDGAEAEYFEAASTDLHRKLPGSYALLWQVIQDLKILKVQRFNLWGIAPSTDQKTASPKTVDVQSSQKQDRQRHAPQKQHRYAGVTTFKTGFGGEIVEFVPAQDIVIKRGRYLVNLLIETIRKKKRHLG